MEQPIAISSIEQAARINAGQLVSIVFEAETSENHVRLVNSGFFEAAEGNYVKIVVPVVGNPNSQLGRLGYIWREDKFSLDLRPNDYIPQWDESYEVYLQRFKGLGVMR